MGNPRAVATFNLTPPNVSVIFDTIRPWPATEVNFNFEVPIFAARQNIIGRDAQTNAPISTPVNKIIGADIGWTTPTFALGEITTGTPRNPSTLEVTSNNDRPMNYESYLERTSLALTPEFETEQVHSLAVWADGNTIEQFQAEPSYNRFEVRSAGTNNPADLPNLVTMRPELRQNTYFVSEDYKIDFKN